MKKKGDGESKKGAFVKKSQGRKRVGEQGNAENVGKGIGTGNQTVQRGKRNWGRPQGPSGGEGEKKKAKDRHRDAKKEATLARGGNEKHKG